MDCNAVTDAGGEVTTRAFVPDADMAFEGGAGMDGSEAASEADGVGDALGDTPDGSSDASQQDEASFVDAGPDASDG